MVDHPFEIKRNKSGRAILRRRRVPEFEALIAPYAMSTGRVLWEWNSLHARLFRMFWLFVGNHGRIPRDLATDLWHSVQSDEHQRRMLSAIAENILFEQPKELATLRWLLGVIREIAAYRNIAAHVAMDVHELASASGFYVGFELDGQNYLMQENTYWSALRKRNFGGSWPKTFTCFANMQTNSGFT